LSAGNVAAVRAPVSVVILAKNERDRLAPALESVAFADEVVVADTGSTDGTQELARLAGARVVPIGWEGFVASRNRALAEAQNDWVLVLDADERVPEALRAEILAVLEKDDPAVAGYRMPRLSHFLGRPVRHGTWYPDLKLRLGRRSRGLRAEGGRVHETLEVDGAVGRLAAALVHHPYRDFSDALRKAARYAELGAEDRYERGARGGAVALFGRPLFEFTRSLFVRGGLLDGSVGVSVALLHASSYFLRTAFLLEIERRHRSDPRPDPLRRNR
jgi:glycosyltransferase involved in cell wall biosynthesis